MSASDSAKSRMERILRLHEQIDALKLDIRQVYAEEKADGGDKTAMGAAVSYIRKRDKEGSDLADREAMADVYLAAYDAPRAHTHTRENLSYSQSGLTYADEKGRGDHHVQPVGTLEASAKSAQDDVGATASSTNSATAHKPAGDLAADKQGDKDRGSFPVGGPDHSNSPEGVNEVPAQDGGGTALDESHGDKSNAARPASVDAHVNGGRLAGEVSAEAVTVVGDESGTLTNSHSQASSSQPANSVGGAPSSSPASPARHSDDIDLTIPAFLRRDEGRGYPKREAVEA